MPNWAYAVIGIVAIAFVAKLIFRGIKVALWIAILGILAVILMRVLWAA